MGTHVGLGGGELFADAGAGAGGDDEGCGENEAAADARAGAEGFVEDEDAEDGADEGFHVEQDSGLRGRDLGHAPVPEQGGGGGAEEAAGGEGKPCFERDVCDGREAVDERDADEQHQGSGGGSVGADYDGAVTLHEALVEQDPAEGDDEREDYEEVSGEGWAGGARCGLRGGVARAECDECGADGGDGQGEPAGCVHALVGEERGGDCEQDGHGADHERGVRDGGAREAGELDEELERDSEKGAEQEGAPLAAVEAGLVGEEQRDEGERGEEEAVEDHRADAHFGECDFSEEEAAAPEGTGDGAGCEAEGAIFGGHESYGKGISVALPLIAIQPR